MASGLPSKKFKQTVLTFRAGGNGIHYICCSAKWNLATCRCTDTLQQQISYEVGMTEPENSDSPPSIW